MGPIVSVVSSHGQQNPLQKANQSVKPGIATVHGYCMSMAISWAEKV